MNITVPRKQLLAFRNQCRANYPRETMAVLHGSRTADGVTITDIKPIPHVGTEKRIQGITPEDVRRAKSRALRAGSELIGTIHSHCDVEGDPACWHLSKTDIVEALKDGEAICGLVYVDDGGHRTAVHWYVPSPIPEVDYV